MSRSAPRPSVYLDHAASTPLRKEVRERMIALLEGPYGNPSSVHQYGRKARVVVEEARKYVAGALGCSPGEIVFTSGGTEADNAALHLAVEHLGVQRIITSPLEHKAVLEPVRWLQQHRNVTLEWVQHREDGRVNLDHLRELLEKEKAGKTLVSLMHGNNEIGNLLPLEETGRLCHEHAALFHSDTVQTVGHFPLLLAELPVDFITASAHKFYGPKGVGFLYARHRHHLGAYVMGGGQERNRRGGTENILGIAGLQIALKWALENLEEERNHILRLKIYLRDLLKERLPQVRFHGQSAEEEKSLYTVLSAGFPAAPSDGMLLFNLDIRGVAVSGGSACASGSMQGSHVIEHLYPGAAYPVLRFSLGKDNTREEVEYSLGVLEELLKGT